MRRRRRRDVLPRVGAGRHLQEPGRAGPGRRGRACADEAIDTFDAPAQFRSDEFQDGPVLRPAGGVRAGDRVARQARPAGLRSTSASAVARACVARRGGGARRTQGRHRAAMDARSCRPCSRRTRWWWPTTRCPTAWSPALSRDGVREAKFPLALPRADLGPCRCLPRCADQTESEGRGHRRPDRTAAAGAARDRARQARGDRAARARCTTCRSRRCGSTGST